MQSRKKKNKHEIEGAERKLLIYEYLCQEKKAQMTQLAKMFKVSVRTIQRDLALLETVFRLPIEVKKGRYGGVYVIGDLLCGRVYMKEEETLLMKKIKVLIKDRISEDELLLFDRIIQKYQIA